MNLNTGYARVATCFSSSRLFAKFRAVWIATDEYSFAPSCDSFYSFEMRKLIGCCQLGDIEVRIVMTLAREEKIKYG